MNGLFSLRPLMSSERLEGGSGVLVWDLIMYQDDLHLLFEEAIVLSLKERLESRIVREKIFLERRYWLFSSLSRGRSLYCECRLRSSEDWARSAGVTQGVDLILNIFFF